MQVQVNTDRNIEGDETLTGQVEAAVRGALDRFDDKITRVEIHLTDENSDKKGGADDVRCLMEARLAGLQPVSVSHRGPTVDEAVDGAAGKLTRALESRLGRLERR